MKKNILIVDDEAPMRKMVGQIVGKAGHTSQGAGDVQEARRLLAAHAFDIIFLDIHMPGESGLDLLEEASDCAPDTAIIMLTGDDDPRVVDAAFNYGAYGYLVKPISRNQLLIQLANALSRQALEIERRSYQQQLESAVAERTQELEKANRHLRKNEATLQIQADDLNEMNIALKVLLKKRQEDKENLEDSIATNLKRMVFPYLEKLKQSKLHHRQMAYIELIESVLADVAAPMLNKLSSKRMDLTPTELEVVQFIEQGKSSKEIADLLNLSVNTVLTHRYKIRRKLGLLNQKVNLRSYLRSMQ